MHLVLPKKKGNAFLGISASRAGRIERWRGDQGQQNHLTLALWTGETIDPRLREGRTRRFFSASSPTRCRCIARPNSSSGPASTSAEARCVTYSIGRPRGFHRCTRGSLSTSSSRSMSTPTRPLFRCSTLKRPAEPTSGLSSLRRWQPTSTAHRQRLEDLTPDDEPRGAAAPHPRLHRAGLERSAPGPRLGNLRLFGVLHVQLVRHLGKGRFETLRRLRVRFRAPVDLPSSALCQIRDNNVRLLNNDSGTVYVTGRYKVQS